SKSKLVNRRGGDGRPLLSRHLTASGCDCPPACAEGDRTDTVMVRAVRRVLLRRCLPACASAHVGLEHGRTSKRPPPDRLWREPYFACRNPHHGRPLGALYSTSTVGSAAVCLWPRGVRREARASRA